MVKVCLVKLHSDENHWTLPIKINLGSGNGFVTPGKKQLPEPKLTHIYVTMVSLSQNELINLRLKFSSRLTCHASFIVIQRNSSSSASFEVSKQVVKSCYKLTVDQKKLTLTGMTNKNVNWLSHCPGFTIRHKIQLVLSFSSIIKRLLCGFPPPPTPTHPPQKNIQIQRLSMSSSELVLPDEMWSQHNTAVLIRSALCNSLNAFFALRSHQGPHKLRLLTMIKMLSTHDDVIKWKHYPRYWPFGWIPRTKASDAELWFFLWSASE